MTRLSGMTRFSIFFSHWVLYESLLADPEEETTRLFDKLGISRDFVHRLVQAEGSRTNRKKA